MESKKSTKSTGCAILLVIGLLVVVWSWWTGREARLNKPAAEQCLSAWDGSHPGLVSATKVKMNDPESFEHVETRYIDRGQEIDLIMKFRGKNALGGKVTQTVTGTISADCELIKGPIGL